MIGFLVFVGLSISIYTIFSLGLNLQWGFTGLVNFGQVAFMTVGAYVTVLLSMPPVNLPMVVAVLVGVILASLLGLVMGLATLRLREDYLGIVTIGMSEVIRLMALNEEWLTKGAFGVQNYPIPLSSPSLFTKFILIGLILGLSWFSIWQSKRANANLLTPDKNKRIWLLEPIILVTFVIFCVVISLMEASYKAQLLLLSVVSMLAIYVVMERLVKSGWGRILKAIREDEQVPRALGKDVFSYKMQSLMLGGAISGLAGAFYAWNLTTVYSTSFEPLITFNGWIIVVLGGAAANIGTLLGSIVFWSYDSLTLFVIPKLVRLDDSQIGAFRIMILGLILIVLMMYRPQGILGNSKELTLKK